MAVASNFGVKHRALTLKQMIGVDDIAPVVRGWVKGGRIPQTIIIVGPSGCGKTTLARIIARMLQKWPLDKSIESCPDVIEKDVADQRKIDDVREVIQTAKYAPMQCPYRIFILDEAHALVSQAMSAFLKSLEEPSPQTIFMLCTNYPDKLPPEILRRGEKILIRRPQPDEMIPLLARVCEAERIILHKDTKQEDEIFIRIAEAANCSPSESLNILKNMADRIAGGIDPKASLQQAIHMVMDVGAERAAIKSLVAIYLGRPAVVLATIQDTSDYNGYINKLLALNQALLQDHQSGGPRWQMAGKLTLVKLLREQQLKPPLPIVDLLHVHAELVEMKTKMGSYLVAEPYLFSARLGNLALGFRSNK